MDDDDSSTFNSLLYCDEEPFDSTPPPPEQQQRRQLAVRTPDDDDEEEVMEYYKAKQRSYAPQRDYCFCLQQQQQQLQHGVSTARLKAVRYIIYAMGRLGLDASTAFNAVNYLDRFLSINCHLRWEEWMVEVVSVACLSLACKLDEVTIPSLHDLQMEEAMGHSFRPSTVGDMELTLLKALRWRLACVTPFSFLLPAAATAAAAASHILLRSLLDPSFLRFDASLLAASALVCTIHPQPHHLSAHVNRLIHPLRQTDHEVKECFNMMRELNLDLSNNPGRCTDQLWSPISVVPFQTDGTVNRSAVSRRLFGGLNPEVGDNTEEDKDSGLCTFVQEMK
ncbi:putative cyclin-D7-1 [Oryza brachyantha]|uniref:putative cyclin-D7-1 n=1 Tax=Oryza brachyantha TaxID=4533 RepID=UPI0007762949|nr:putative cyclin-D7-1 [Oryza brachyantha]